MKIESKDVIKYLIEDVGMIATRGSSFFLTEVKFEHRTNQQAIAGVVFALIKQWANDFDNNNFDARNEATVTLSARIVDALGDDFPVGRLPLI
jgi:hypothetical protein